MRLISVRRSHPEKVGFTRAIDSLDREAKGLVVPPVDHQGQGRRTGEKKAS